MQVSINMCRQNVDDRNQIEKKVSFYLRRSLQKSPTQNCVFSSFSLSLSRTLRFHLYSVVRWPRRESSTCREEGWRHSDREFPLRDALVVTQDASNVAFYIYSSTATRRETKRDFSLIQMRVPKRHYGYHSVLRVGRDAAWKIRDKTRSRSRPHSRERPLYTSDNKVHGGALYLCPI